MVKRANFTQQILLNLSAISLLIGYIPLCQGSKLGTSTIIGYSCRLYASIAAVASAGHLAIALGILPTPETTETDTRSSQDDAASYAFKAAGLAAVAVIAYRTSKNFIEGI